jgi:O-antigen/teichoic acid export membrane protein
VGDSSPGQPGTTPGAASPTPERRGRLATEDAREAIIWRAGYLIVQGGLSVLLFAVLAQTLGARPFAAAAVAQGVIVLAQSVGDLGFSQGAVTVLPARLALEGDAGLGRVLAGAALGSFAAAALGFVLCLGAAFIVPGAARLPVLLMAPAAAVTVLVSGADGLLRAQGQFRRPVLLVTASRVAAFAGVAGAVATGSAAVTSATIAGGTILGSVPAALVVAGYLGEGAVTEARWFLRSAAPLALAQLTFVAGGRINTLILSAVGGVREGAVFEAAWRLFSLGQYAAGALATGVAPFLADALGAKRWGDVRRMIRIVGAVSLGGALVTAVGLFALRRQLGELFAGSLGDAVSGALLPLAIVTPFAFVGFFVLTVLAASDRYRRWILPSYAAGALVNITCVAVLASSDGASGATAAASAGIVVTSIGLAVAARRFASSYTP